MRDFISDCINAKQKEDHRYGLWEALYNIGPSYPLAWYLGEKYFEFPFDTQVFYYLWHREATVNMGENIVEIHLPNLHIAEKYYIQ